LLDNVTNGIPSLQAAVGDIHLDRLIAETDSTASGQSAGPVEVISVAEKLASLRGSTIEEIADTATANLKRLLKL
jgi:Tat protein secretion system quality control protein TatD with DNase activity